MKKIALVFLLALSACGPKKEYTVRVVYCDKRPDDTVRVESYIRPSNSQISTYKRAVSRWENYLNVCEVRVLDERPAE